MRWGKTQLGRRLTMIVRTTALLAQVLPEAYAKRAVADAAVATGKPLESVGFLRKRQIQVLKARPTHNS